MRKLRVAQIGVLHEHSDGKMLTLRNRMQDVFEVVAIAAENQDAAQSWRPHAWEQPCYAGLNRVGKEELFRMELDAVFVETELRELVPTARECLAHGLPVHIDKPGGLTLEPYAELVRDYHRAGILLQPGYMLRNSKAVQQMKQIVRDGVLGEIYEVDANMHRPAGSELFCRYMREIPGGTMFDYGSHLIDVILDMLGVPEEITAIGAHLSREILWHAEHLEVTAADADPAFRFDRWEVKPSAVAVQSERILEDGSVSIHLLNNSAESVEAEIFCNGRKLKQVSLAGKELAEVAL